MKACFLLLLSLATTFLKVTAYKGYYDCTDDDCSFYDTEDPRNSYMGLWDNVEDGINDTLAIPSWKMELEFYDGYLSISKDDYDLECACPVILKEDKTFVTIHSFLTLDLWYSYKFPISRDKDGAVQITCVYAYSALLMNETNSYPICLKLEITSLNIFNFIPYGIPMKWIDNLPDKYINLLKDALYSPIKRLLEETLLQAYNEQLEKMYGPRLNWLHDNSVL